ncbi:aspartyl-tRNA(Asn)/glutamyl-tRNA(Gln) amidotransferase subunit B [Desulfitispora alkaliphila]|uniref:Asp-tRNA(Asn)/Glu-tRNA(Gln) amidotransferase subunit GatB n=1 Tax=Desulfitispora alkaliphila TaxID=622674 RepID=UPI003D21DC6C
MTTEYEVVIGLEIHAELKTNTKIFCGCANNFNSDQNENVCPICLGMPGTLPVLNKEVVELATRAGLALNCNIAEFNKFDRKNYFYPDVPKNFQTSQLDLPIALNGEVKIEVDGEEKIIRVNRVHMEEDAGKLSHQGSELITASEGSLVDYNRGGVPLIEIVSEPDMRSPEEARAYLEKVKAILEYTQVSDCKMEEGSLRCDANISLRPKGETKLGTKTEIKNMNSFKALLKALEYEIERQEDVLDEGEKVVQETRSWDEAKGVTVSMRSKEEAHDYRYFPEPDLVPVVIEKSWIIQIKENLPELPDQRKKRLVQELELPEYDAQVITSSKDLADFFDQCVKEHHNPKLISNWIMGDLLGSLNAENMEIADCKIEATQLAQLVKLIDENTISGKIAKKVFAEMFETGKGPKTIVEEKGLVQITDEGAIAAIVDKVIEANPKSVEDYRSGKEKAIGFLVGQVMKETKGKANPGMVNKLIKDRL